MAAHIGYTDLYTHNSYPLAQCFVLYVMSKFNWGQFVSQLALSFASLQLLPLLTVTVFVTVAPIVIVVFTAW